MEICQVTVTPIEFISENDLDLFKSFILAKRLIAPNNDCEDLIKDLFSKDVQYYALNGSGDSVFCLFIESSMCLINTENTSIDSLTSEAVRSLLLKRKSSNNLINNNCDTSPFYEIINCLEKVDYPTPYFTPRIHYSFSFCVIQSSNFEHVNEGLLKVLAEPSLVGCDDMTSTNVSQAKISLDSIKQDRLNAIRDVDLASSSKTYVTWATIVSITNENDFKSTIALLSLLEVRLQSAWNKCYEASLYIDEIIKKNINPKKFIDLYWEFVRDLDSLKSVLSSTYSSRADSLFQEMIKTSKLEKEMHKLEQKAALFEKYVEKKKTQVQNRYQITIELLLFVTALSSITQVFLPIPFNYLPTHFEVLIICFLAVVGAFAIFKGK